MKLSNVLAGRRQEKNLLTHCGQLLTRQKRMEKSVNTQVAHLEEHKMKKAHRRNDTEPGDFMQEYDNRFKQKVKVWNLNELKETTPEQQRLRYTSIKY